VELMPLGIDVHVGQPPSAVRRPSRIGPQAVALRVPLSAAEAQFRHLITLVTCTSLSTTFN